nr:hypothetical protein [Tanacetum cinerariifolium]
MSNTNNTMQTQTSNALHNAIMEAGGKDRPPMLAPVAEDSTETTTERYIENYKNVLQDIHDQLNAEAVAVQIILAGIDNDIYSTVDACPNECEMNLENTSRDGESLKSYYSRFYKMMNELVRNQCDVTDHQHQNEVNEIRAERLARTANPLALVAQQQPIYHPQNHPTHYTQNYSTRLQQAATRNRGKAIVRSPPPIYDQEPTMVAEDDEMSKDKEIDKLMALISLSFKKVYKPTNNNLQTSSNTSRANQDNSLRINKGTGYDNQRIVNVVGARETVGRTVVQKSGIQCYNCKEYGHVARECQKPKRAKDAAYHKKKMLLCKQEEAGFQLNAEQADWRDDTNDDPDDQELEAHYMYMAQIQEVTPDDVDNSGPIFDSKPLQKVPNNDNYNVFSTESEHPEQSKSVNDTYPIEQDEHNMIIDSLDMSYDREQVDQDDDDLANERDFLDSLNKKLECEIEDFKTKNKSLESSNNHFKEANNELSKTNRLMFKDLKKFQAKLDRYHNVKYASKVEIDYAKAKGDLMSYKMVSEKSFNEYTRKINDLNQTISEMKQELFAHQETISITSQEKEAQIKFYKTRKDKEIDKVITLENKVKVLDNIVYKTDQSVQTMNMLNRNCKTSIAKPEFLKKAQRANPRLYDIGCYNDNLALMLAPESDEVVSKSSAITTTDTPNHRQQQQTTPLNNHTTTDPTCQDPTHAPSITSSENINQAETNLKNAQVADDEFINIFCTSIQDRGETSSHHVDSSNMHTFYQQHPSEHGWMKDHLLEQVIGNPSQSVRTRRQLESDGKMCMFALTVSQTEPKNIKEAMADSPWIESMQEELYQFDQLDVWE